MEEKALKEMNEESRARGVKRSSETKIAEVSTNKKKRLKKAKAAIPAPTIEDSDKIEVSEQSEATPRRRSTATAIIKMDRFRRKNSKVGSKGSSRPETTKLAIIRL